MEHKHFVAANVGENGFYENVSKYIRDLIRLFAFDGCPGHRA
jgi:Arc/MetJ-type ribon-helix-helix transcriptional regulator